MLRWLARISKCKHRCMRASISINFKDIRKRTVTREPKSGNNFNVLRRQPHLQHVERRSLFLGCAAFPRYGIMENRGKSRRRAKLFNDDRELSNFPCIFRRAACLWLNALVPVHRSCFCCRC